jgi:hypothetical protein
MSVDTSEKKLRKNTGQRIIIAAVAPVSDQFYRDA